MEAVWRPMDRLWTKQRKVAEAIRKAKAHTLFGIGVKLSVVEGPDEQDWIEALDDGRQALGELIGVDFIAAAGPAAREFCRMPDRAEFNFTVKEFASGTPWIVAEPMNKMLSIGGMIGFDLKPGTTMKQAHEIADYMRKHIEGISYTP